MCRDEEKNIVVLLGTGNQPSLSSQVLENKIWTKTNLQISQRTVSQYANLGGQTYIWSGKILSILALDMSLNEQN